MVGTLRLACFVLVSLTFCQASITPCRLDDEKCLISTAKVVYSKIMTSDSSIGTEILDPVWIDKVDGSLTILHYKIENATVRGYADCHIKHLSIDKSQSSLKFNILCPEIVMIGNYEMNGRLIVLPVEGVGNFTLTIYSYNIHFDVEFKIVKTDDGKEYMSIKDYNFDASTKKGAHFYFDNLFNGRKDLADTVLRFANENSIEVLDGFQKPALTATYNKFIKNVNKYLKAMPMEHLFAE